MAQAALTSPMWLKAWGKLPSRFPADGIDLLSEQADVVDEGSGPFEDGAGPSRLSGAGQGLGQPEGA